MISYYVQSMYLGFETSQKWLNDAVITLVGLKQYCTDMFIKTKDEKWEELSIIFDRHLKLFTDLSFREDKERFEEANLAITNLYEAIH